MLKREAGLTVAIPTMNRWESFLKRQIQIYLDHPKVNYVVVSDETGEDVEAICAAGLDMHPKIRLYVNERVLGVYGNKRQCMLRAPTEWVAILDSDNTFSPNFFDAFWVAVERDGAAANRTMYAAGGIERLFLDSGRTEDRTSQFAGMRISRENWNSMFGRQGWNFLFNDGNTVWNTAVAGQWPDMPEEEIVGTDSIFALRQAIQAGFTLCVEPTMRYIHTVHDGSHWLQNAAVSTRLLNQRDWRV